MIDEMFIYLAVAENKQFFAQMIPYMLLNVNREPNCLIALFLGKADVMRSKFKRLILDGTFEPVWIRTPDATTWICSLSTPEWVTVQCQKTGSPPTTNMSYGMQLERTGDLSNLSSCYIYAENFKLLPHSLGKSTVALIKTHIIPPNVEKILHNSEENVLQFTATQPTDLQRLDDILIRATSRSHVRGAEVNKIIDVLQEADTSRQSLPWLRLVCIAMLFLVIGALWPIWFRLAVKYCPCLKKGMTAPTQHSNSASTQILNECEIELQMMRNRSAEEEPRMARDACGKGEDSRESPTPTAFVRHGQGIAYR